MARTIITETPTNASEIKKILEDIKSKEEELGFRSQRTLEHLETITVLAPKKAKDLEAALTKLNVPRLRDVHIHKVIDTLPKTQDEVKLVLQGFAVTITNENCKKIADAVIEVA